MAAIIGLDDGERAQSFPGNIAEPDQRGGAVRRDCVAVVRSDSGYRARGVQVVPVQHEYVVAPRKSSRREDRVRGAKWHVLPCE
jgi:hypothetical protein